jgi:hypothetical protein
MQKTASKYAEQAAVHSRQRAMHPDLEEGGRGVDHTPDKPSQKASMIFHDFLYFIHENTGIVSYNRPQPFICPSEFIIFVVPIYIQSSMTLYLIQCP